jgi:hypothetical protein
LIPNPIHKVLSTLFSHEVRHLLMGGQACVFYGAAEFSRDCDIVIEVGEENLARLAAAIRALEGQCIAVPPFDREYLDRGHAVHFRCHHPDARNIRLDVMAKLRGVDSFLELWQRRLTLQDVDGTLYEVLGIEDLVKAKKTQRDKDWPMIRRLVDAHYDEFRDNLNWERARFWLRESRTPAVLIRLAASCPDVLADVLPQRPLLCEALAASESALERELHDEQARERAADEAYWRPLKKELQTLRATPRRNWE